MADAVLSFVRRWGRGLRLVSGLVTCLALGACAVGPDYERPALDLGAAYEHAPAGHWRRAESPATPVAVSWWLRFEDAGLNALMARLNAGNPDLAQAEARYRQAQAAIRASGAGLFPTLDLSSSVERSGQGRSGPENPSNQYGLSASVRWELDLWGRVRRTLEADRASAQASQADLAATRLSLQSTLAQTYVQWRASQHEDAVLAQTIAEDARALEMTQHRFEAGVAASADVAAARMQLDQARARRIRLRWQREQQVHAMAVLVGVVPSAFEAPAPAELPSIPEIPVGIPSALLQQRPDIAAAERRVAEANARIGVAQAAWFPELTLSAQGGFRAGEFASWLMTPARFWTLGPALAVSLFDGGARSAAVDSARAAYDTQAALYRKTVLDAMKEVEDLLVQSQALVEELAAEQRARDAAHESLRQTLNQYEAGLIDYLSVVQAQTSALNADQTVVDLRSQRLVAAIQLIAALGGGPMQGVDTGSTPPASSEAS